MSYLYPSHFQSLKCLDTSLTTSTFNIHACTSRLDFQAHVYLPVWERWWIFRFSKREKHFPQTIHSCGFSLVCVRIWICILYLKQNTHTVHTLCYCCFSTFLIRTGSKSCTTIHYDSFVFLLQWCFTTYFEIFHLYNDNQNYGERKLGTTGENPQPWPDACSPHFTTEVNKSFG